jgi:PKHD-type hydroxylase
LRVSQAGQVKNNLQMEGAPDSESMYATVVRALARHDVVKAACLPSRVLRPMFSRYEAGMSYGWHIDNPLLGEGRPIRTDIAVTVFLSDPGEYEGGALVVNVVGGQARFRLPKGHAVAYPATTLHCVEPVTKGVRNAAVTWIESFVADAARRELLHDLDRASRIVREKAPNSDEARLLMKTHVNLVRMWAET